jgi:hypothetical protein
MSTRKRKSGSQSNSPTSSNGGDPSIEKSVASGFVRPSGFDPRPDLVGIGGPILGSQIVEQAGGPSFSTNADDPSLLTTDIRDGAGSVLDHDSKIRIVKGRTKIAKMPYIVNLEISKWHNAARLYAAAGVPVIPLAQVMKWNELTKMELPYYFPRVCDNPSTDLAQIDTWWSENPQYWIGTKPIDGANLYLLQYADTCNFTVPETLKCWNGHLPVWWAPLFTSAGYSGPIDAAFDFSDFNKLDFAVLSVNGPFVPIAPLPDWVEDHYYGRDLIEAGLDTPKQVAAAIEFLKCEEPETSHNPSRAEKARWAEEHPGETYTPSYFSTQCTASMVLCGISESKCLRLLDAHWNTRNDPPLSKAVLREQIHKVMTNHPDVKPENRAESWRDLRWRSLPEVAAATDPLDLDAFDAVPPKWFLGQVLGDQIRAMLYAPTGRGKTTFCLALASHVAAGRDFLHWRVSEPKRVLYVDGEMPLAMMKQRHKETLTRLGVAKLPELVVVSHAMLPGGLLPLDTDEGQRVIDNIIETRGPFDLVIFDNVNALLAGRMVDEQAWARVKPWAVDLTDRKIGQLWVHHSSNHDTRHFFGTDTLGWQMDAIIQLATVPHPDADLAFAVKFEKARWRDRDNRGDFDTAQVQLTARGWHTSAGAKPTADRVALIEAALAAAGAVDWESGIAVGTLAKLLAGGDEDAVADELTRLHNNAKEKRYSHLWCQQQGDARRERRWFFSSTNE